MSEPAYPLAYPEQDDGREWPRQGDWTYEGYRRLPNDGRRYEVVDVIGKWRIEGRWWADGRDREYWRVEARGGGKAFGFDTVCESLQLKQR